MATVAIAAIAAKSEGKLSYIFAEMLRFAAIARSSFIVRRSRGIEGSTVVRHVNVGVQSCA